MTIGSCNNSDNSGDRGSEQRRKTGHQRHYCRPSQPKQYQDEQKKTKKKKKKRQGMTMTIVIIVIVMAITGQKTGHQRHYCRPSQPNKIEPIRRRRRRRKEKEEEEAGERRMNWIQARARTLPSAFHSPLYWSPSS